MNTDDTIENKRKKQLQGRMPEKYISMKRYYRTPERTFIDHEKFVAEDIIKGCTFCKISIVLLILLSFILVRPAKNQQVTPIQDMNTVNVTTDTTHLQNFYRANNL